MNRLREFWQFITRDERELPDLNPTVEERGWSRGKEITSRLDVRLLERVVKAKAQRTNATA